MIHNTIGPKKMKLTEDSSKNDQCVSDHRVHPPKPKASIGDNEDLP